MLGKRVGVCIVYMNETVSVTDCWNDWNLLVVCCVVLQLVTGVRVAAGFFHEWPNIFTKVAKNAPKVANLFSKVAKKWPKISFIKN